LRKLHKRPANHRDYLSALNEHYAVRLKGKNLELQRAVEIGNTRSQQQEQELDKQAA